MATTPKKYRVLIVDDEPTVVQFAERTLQIAGYETITADDGDSALVAAGQCDHVDLLLTDLVMPNMPGDELARTLRRQDPDLPVLYLTGFSDRLFKDRSQLWANEAYVDKPISMNALLEAVSLALFGHTKGPSTASS